MKPSFFPPRKSITKKSLGLLLLFLSWNSQAWPDYAELFYGQRDHQDLPGMGKTLQDWGKAAPNDVEWLVASGIYFSMKARQEGVPRPDPPAIESPVIRLPDPPGREAPRDYAHLNYALTDKAAQSWLAALQAAPWRLDAYLDLERLYQDLGDFDSQYDTLVQVLKYADKHWKSLRVEEGQTLPKRSAEYIPEVLQEPISHYLNQSEPESQERALRLAKLVLTFYPRHSAYAYNSIAAYYAGKRDWPHVLKNLLIARQRAPKNSLILCNIGNSLVKIGKNREARIFYREALRCHSDADSIEIARNFLAKKTSKDREKTP